MNWFTLSPPIVPLDEKEVSAASMSTRHVRSTVCAIHTRAERGANFIPAQADAAAGDSITA
jgi:hypothetical protein